MLEGTVFLRRNQIHETVLRYNTITLNCEYRSQLYIGNFRLVNVSEYAIICKAALQMIVEMHPWLESSQVMWAYNQGFKVYGYTLNGLATFFIRGTT